MTYQIIALSKHAEDITGKTFGRLTAIAPVGKSPGGHIKWLCICDCGTESVAEAGNLKRRTRSCGCLGTEMSSKRNTTHGMAGRPEYNSWASLRSRCLSKTDPGYSYYGGRGIKICDRWVDSFENFYADMGARPSTKHSIDRINNEEGYSKRNCRWATRKEQARNKRNNVILTFNGKTLCAPDWERKTGIRATIIRQRISRGWSEERSLTQTVRRSSPRPKLSQPV
jgi:hypothetical protein